MFFLGRGKLELSIRSYYSPIYIKSNSHILSVYCPLYWFLSHPYAFHCTNSGFSFSFVPIASACLTARDDLLVPLQAVVRPNGLLEGVQGGKHGTSSVVFCDILDQFGRKCGHPGSWIPRYQRLLLQLENGDLSCPGHCMLCLRRLEVDHRCTHLPTPSRIGTVDSLMF